MKQDRLRFERSISRAIEEIQRKEKTRCQVQGGNGNYSNRIQPFQIRHAPGNVKHYREADFKNDIPPEKLRILSKLVDLFREKTEEIDLLKPVVSADIQEIDEILLQMHSILEGVSNEM